MAAWNLIQLHMYQGSPLFPIFRAASTVIPLLPKATYLNNWKKSSTLA